MPESPRYLFDLDRTLFDTDRFIAWLWGWLARDFGVDAETEAARATEFYQYHGDSYDYLFFEHAASISPLAAVSPDSLVAQAVEASAGRSFLMPDATPDVLKMVTAIVTFGNPAYQQLKVALCPELAAIPCHITYDDKPGVIARLFPNTPAILVDDKPQPRPWPPQVRCVLLDRAGAYPDYPGPRIRSLADV